MIYIDPSEPDRFVTVTYATLTLYSLYSGVLYYATSGPGATVIAVVRDGRTEINPGPGLRIEAEDVLVLLGGPAQIDRAVELLGAGGAAAV